MGKFSRRWHRTSLTATLLLVTVPAVAGVVPTESGLVRGARQGGIDVYKAIPFAAPPLGRLRWREPQPVAPWNGIRAANTFAPACMQTGVSMPGETPPKVNEDCLYLNVWTRARNASAHLPVIVWIYGGGFFNGSASMPLYWGDQLARKGAVVVTLAYRLGPFGFLAHPELTAESPHHSSGNYAFLDQIAALQWVRKNVAAFGGDPARVTIAGQSAGAASVSILMASPLAAGLFQRAIGESGGMFEPMKLAPNYQLANAEHDGEAYAASLGVHSLVELRALPADMLLKGKAGPISHPVIEPYALPQSPYDVFLAGRQNDVPILVGSNADEARSLVSHLETVKASSFAADITKSWGPLPPQLLAAYPYVTDEDAKKARLAFERDLRFAWDDWAWARLEAMKGRNSVYYYHFAHAPPFPKGSVYEGWGPSHFSELWYTFNHLEQEKWAWTAADRKLADMMSSYWVNFAASGNPNGPGLAEWPQFTASTSRVLILDDPVAPGDVANLKSLHVFDTVYDQVRGSKFGEALAR
ncbi:MAG TPA: carboxylesterase family protein [Rhizomicrobium sp.]|jgi:para-nitrobenzyl esterase|nr:carboxylesterase family protein [Rhizomicrobium sp.]